MPIDNINKRRQKQLDKAKEEKKLLSIWSRYMKLLSSKRNNVEIVELDKPVRSGYHRFFVLREDVARSDDAPLYKKLLVEMQSHQYSKNKEFLYKSYPSNKLVPMEHNLSFIEHKRWNELNYTPKQAAMFDQLWIQHRDVRGRLTKSGRYVFAFKKPWAFVAKVQPHYITHRIVINPQLESEIKELYDKIYHAHVGPKLFKLMGWKWSSDHDDWEKTRTKILEKIIEKEKFKILNENVILENV
jgi:hypothetical protein